MQQSNLLNRKKILIFGGAFDPPHLGHLNLCKASIETIHPDLTIIIPNRTQPLKSNQSISNAKDRYNMCELCFHDILNVEISDFEISRKSSRSYTYKTIEHLLKLYPNDHLYLLIGYDRIHDFIHWKNYEYILDNVTLVGSVRNKSEKLLDTFSGIVVKNYQPVEITSSDLRVEPTKKYLTPLVARYIATKGIYCEQQVKPLMSNYRYAHTLRVDKTAKQIATLNHYPYPLKVHIAAMYHDIGKEFSDKKILNMVKKYDRKRFPTIHTLHGVASMIYAKQHFNITDQETLAAIANHCVPSKNPSTLDKIIYLADKLEPSRTNKDVPYRRKILAIAYHNIDKAFDLLVKTMNSKYNKQKANK